MWKAESARTERALGDLWPSKVGLKSPSLERKVFVAAECRLGRLFLKKTHDTFAKFATAGEVLEQFKMDHQAALEGKEAELIGSIAGQSAVSEGESKGTEGRVRFDSAGRTMDQSVLLRETGLEKGVYVVQKPAANPTGGHCLFPGPSPQLEGFCLLLYVCISMIS